MGIIITMSAISVQVKPMWPVRDIVLRLAIVLRFIVVSVDFDTFFW